jgi:NADH dehydrogenase
MLAKIYRPAKSAMTSGQANTKQWVLEMAPGERRRLDPLMGWTGQTDMNGQVKLHFASKEEAVDYAQRHKLPFVVSEPKARRHVVRPKGYGQNFSTERRQPWTH